MPLGEPAGAGVVVGEPLDVVVERVERRRGDGGARSSALRPRPNGAPRGADVAGPVGR